MKRIATQAALFGFAAILAASGAQARPRKPAGEPPAAQGEGAAKSEGTKEYETPFPLKMNWSLAEINGKSPPGEATLTIDDNLRGSGLSGCNTWSAALYPVRGHKLAMGPVAQTKKSCEAGLMQFERTYLTILHSGPVWEQKGSTLTIKSQGGTLTFNRGL